MAQRNTCCFSDHRKLCIAYGSYVNNLRKGCPVFQHILFVKSQLLDWATLGKVETNQNVLTLTNVIVGANVIRKTNKQTNKKERKRKKKQTNKDSILKICFGIAYCDYFSIISSVFLFFIYFF